MDLVLPRLLEANGGFQRDEPEPCMAPAAPGRRLVILTCMDSRIDIFRALGLARGDAHVVRNAGGRASDDAIRSLIISTHVLGTREVGVIHHTDCGLAGRTDADLAAETGVEGVAYLAFSDLTQSVRDDVAAIRASSSLPAGIVAWGAVYDVVTGALRVVEQP